MNKFLPFCEKISANKWLINHIPFDARRKDAMRFYGSPLRRCLSLYYSQRNPKLSRLRIDSLICKMLNSNHEASLTIESNCIQFN